MDKLKIESIDLMQLVEALPGACAIFDERSQLARFYNQRFATLWGLPSYLDNPRQLTFSELDSMVATSMLPVTADRGLFNKAIAIELGTQDDYIYLKVRRYFRRQSFSMNFSSGIVGKIELWRDVSQEYKLFHAVQEEHQLLLSLINTIPEQVYIKDKESKFIRINPALAKRYGIERPELAIGLSDADFYSQEHADQTASEEREIMETGKGIFNKLHHETWQDGRETWNLSTKLPFRNRDGETIGIIGISHDITEHKQNEAKFWRQANFDALTGLSNRTHLLAEFQRIQLKSRQQHLPMAMILLDLDGFKTVNDTYGHECGDILLSAVAKRLQTTLRNGDAIARLGGDEFAVIIGNIKDQTDTIRVAEKLLETLSTNFIIDRHVISVTASLGVVLANAQHAEIESLMRQADQAMYQAKQEGKNRYQLFTTELAIDNARRQFLSNEINKSLAANQFSLVYQPLINAKNGELSIFEAFCRWHHDDFHHIEPTEFLPIAESTGAIITIEKSNIQQAVGIIEKFKARSRCIRISLNMSPLVLSQPDELEDLFTEIERTHPTTLQNVYFEVDIDVLFQPSDRIMRSLELASQYGIRLIVDNVGNGYFSLNLLSDLDIELIKLSPKLTNRIGNDPKRDRMIRSLCAMIQSMEVSVCAKHVETAEQYRQLIEIDCEYLQGFHIQRPISAHMLLTQTSAKALETE